MSSDAETLPKQPSKPAIILDADDDKKVLSVGADLDHDGKADIGVKIPIKDPRLWAVIGWVVAGIMIAKDYYNW